MSNTKFYVYMLIDPRTNLPFYIGKGVWHRAKMHLQLYKSDNHNNMKTNKIKKLYKLGMKPIVKIYKNNLHEQTALDVETKLIKKYGRICDKSGILTNVVIDSRCISGKNNPNYGNKWTNKQKSHLSKLKIGKPGYKHTEEHKKYMSSIQSKHRFYSINPNTYEVILWDSVCAYKKAHNLSRNSSLYQAFNSMSCMVQGEYLREIDYDNIENGKIKDIKRFQLECDPRQHSWKKTIQKDLSGNIIKIWNSRKEIIEEYSDMVFSSLSTSITHKKPYKGFLWENHIEK